MQQTRRLIHGKRIVVEYKKENAGLKQERNKCSTALWPIILQLNGAFRFYCQYGRHLFVVDSEAGRGLGTNRRAEATVIGRTDLP